MFGRRKNLIIPPKFSPKLQALMAEWIVYSAYREQTSYYNHINDEEISEIEFFENKAFNSDIYYETFSKLCDLKIIDVKSSKPMCKYEAVRETVFQKLHEIENSVIDYFLEMASALIVNSEKISFEVAPNCLPLFEAFEAEGYVRLEGNKYYWTSKIRSLMERKGYWRQKNYISPEAQFAKKIPKKYRNALNECAARQDIISGKIILRRLPEVQSSNGVKESHKLDPMLIMKSLYPHVWPNEKKLVVWN